MNISVIDPIARALAHTKRILFQPFDLGKWCVLGFTAFIALLSDGGGGMGGGFNIPNGAGRNNKINGDQVIAFITDHLALIGGIAVVVIVLALALSALLLWLGSRGKFMLLDNVAHNRAEVVAPWNYFRSLGNSLFVFEFLLTVVIFLLVLLVLAGAVAIAWRDIAARVFGDAALGAVIEAVIGLALIVCVAALVKSVLRHFVVPVMYLRNLPVLAALRVFGDELLAGHVWSFVKFLLMCLVLGMATGALILLVGCCTCCIGCCLMAIPYLGTVLLLPVIVFWRCYALYFLEQFGAQWRVIAAPDAPVAL